MCVYQDVNMCRTFVYVPLSPLGIQCVGCIQKQFSKHCEDAHPHLWVSVWLKAAVQQRHQLADKLPDHWTYNTHTEVCINTISIVFWGIVCFYWTVNSTNLGREEGRMCNKVRKFCGLN